MAKKTQKSEFMYNMTEIADSLPKIITKEETQGVILLAIETTSMNNKEEPQSAGRITIYGYKTNLIRIMIAFMKNPTSKPLFEAALKKYIHLKGGRNEILKLLQEAD